ncbi:hypothetical protein BU23DRAFT_19447 [Bimuria novae-zelandiae CBS 107.79]|uniref:Uncharacterized protein n=1 Tax=Bimuria novae-zelandiae CBS 107.79 TaxID=1447943 RepID=A0A6A5ULR4_9PLEO|nr:hypothetical protein BU23DRAFT_19447 [Bimuria novae-zelandiae CBS 107.79]
MSPRPICNGSVRRALTAARESHMRPERAWFLPMKWLGNPTAQSRAQRRGRDRRLARWPWPCQNCGLMPPRHVDSLSAAQPVCLFVRCRAHHSPAQCALVRVHGHQRGLDVSSIRFAFGLTRCPAQPVLDLCQARINIKSCTSPYLSQTAGPVGNKKTRTRLAAVSSPNR